MRNIRIATGEHYHVYNRGNEKKRIFHDEKDLARFLTLLLCCQAPVYFPHYQRLANELIKTKTLQLKDETLEVIVRKRYVELEAFALMLNHFHLVLRQLKNGGISSHMQRVLNAYTKYYNTKYNRSGHLFQGPFQIKLVETNEQLLYLSAYTHRNPRELQGWKNKEDQYFWSSYQDYTKKNRWGFLLKTDVVLDQFNNAEEYKEFVDTSSAKTDFEELN